MANAARGAARARRVTTALAVLAAAGALGCSTAAPDEGISLGLLLSYSGYLAANSVNSERAFLMAMEAANAAGGISGRRLRLVAKNTRSDPTKVGVPARELVDAGVSLVIGPDTLDLATQLKTVFHDRTMILPSFATASDIEWKPDPWFVMGAATTRVACELVAQLRGDGHTNPLLVVNTTGYNTQISWKLTNTYAMTKYVLPADEGASSLALQAIKSSSADAFVLAAFPSSASALIYALAASGAVGDPSRWYLSPTLHTPAFLETIPKDALLGARGVAPGTVSSAGDFVVSFAARWDDAALDDAYSFYDAGAIAALALQRAVVKEGAVPTGAGLSKHISAVTHSGGGTPIQWNEIAQGLALVQQGQEVQYVGLSGAIEFDQFGYTPAAGTRWWKIGEGGFTDVPRTVTDCK
jgi:ABC-type branched-subunit amino acid transport system substrate-binding protein